MPPLSDFYPEVLSLPQGIKGHLVVPNLSKVVYMIYDADAQALPCEGRGVQHALFTEERVARDPAFFEPHIPPGPTAWCSSCAAFTAASMKLLTAWGSAVP